MFANMNFPMPHTEELLGLLEVLVDCVLKAFVPITDDASILQVELVTEADYQVLTEPVPHVVTFIKHLMVLANDDNVSICVPADEVVHRAFSIPNTMSSICKENFLEANHNGFRCPRYVDPSRVEYVVGLNAGDLRLQFCIGF